MQRILRKRLLRDLKENVFRYLALGFLVVMGMYIVIGLVGAAEAIIEGTAKAAEESLEDGQFCVFMPLNEQEKRSLEKEGITLEEHFYLDFGLSDASILRIFSQREKIDLVQIDAGSFPVRSGEILLERRYCEEHKIVVGDIIKVGSADYTVAGIGTAPDYESMIRNLSDSAVDSMQFGFGFVIKEDFEEIKNSGESISSEEYFYAYLLNGKMTNQQLKARLRDFLVENTDPSVPKMTRFVSAADNPRIGAAADDKLVDKAAGLAAGVIVLILFAYVISVFTVHHIEKEAGVIGTLYAMGVRKKELLQHYLTLPVLLTFMAGVIGTALGYSRLGAALQMSEAYGYFSIPQIDVHCKPYLLLYGLVMPPLVTVCTNYLVIRKKLDRPALALIRGEQKNAKVHHIKLRGSFVHVFRIRQFLREKRTAVTVFGGMFISLLIVMLSLNCYILCFHVKAENVEDTKFTYMYTYKYPETDFSDGEEAYGVSMKKETLGYNFDVMLLGIHKDNPYFEAEVEKGKSKVLISSAMAQKYGLHVGDIVTLYHEEDDRYYAFFVEGIVEYSAGFFAFMDIDSMREMMGQDETYYNIVFADRELPIDGSRLYSVLSKDEVEKSASVFVAQMKNMVVMLLVVSILMFVVVMYLMMKVMIDRSTMSISLFQVLGYKQKEIKKLYLNGNFCVVAVSALVGIPLSKIIMDSMYPYLVSNIACGINLTFSWQMYAGIFLGTLLMYVLVNWILMFRVNRILPAQVLQNRE